MSEVTESNDSVDIRIPTKLAIGLLTVGLGLGGATSAYLGPTFNAAVIKEMQSKIRALESESKSAVRTSGEAIKQAVRAEALGKAALDLGTENSKQLNHNRDFVVERTFDRYTKQQALDHVREQSSRDAQQDRRIEGLERDLDKVVE